MRTINELAARAKDCKNQIIAIIEKAEKEDRMLTAEEEVQMAKLQEERANWTKQLEIAKQLREDEKQDEQTNDGTKEKEDETVIPKEQPESRDERKFATFGEQMMAVYRAAAPGGKVDARLSTRAASGLNETTPSDGGFLVEKTFVAELLKRTYETGVLASKVRKIPLSNNTNGIKINAVAETSRANGSRWGGIQAYWEEEAGEITKSKPKFRQMELQLKKLTGLCYVTDELLQDAVALEAVLKQGFAEEFGFKMDDAILNGSGTGEPLGILECGGLVTVAKETSQTDKITVENLVKMWARLWGRSRANSVWYINQELEPHLITLTINDVPVYIPAGGLSSTPYATLFGRPVLPLEQCNAAGELGDIVLADLSQYLLIDKGGINAASSVHVRFLYDENVFRFIYRVDGQPIWNSTLTPYKGSATVSPYVTLAKRNA